MAETTYDNTVLDEEELTWADWFSGLGKGSIDSPNIKGALPPGEDWESSLTGEATGGTMLDLLLSNPAGLGLKGLGLGAGVIKSLVPKILTSSKKTKGIFPVSKSGARNIDVIPESIDDLTLRKIVQSPAYRENLQTGTDVLKYIKDFKNNKLIKPILDKNKENLKNIEKLKKEEDLIKRAFKKAVDVSTKKTPKGGASEAGVKEFIGKPTADKYKALSRQDSKNKMMEELKTGAAIGFPPLLAMLSHAKDWPAKLAEKVSPDPVEKYPEERSISYNRKDARGREEYWEMMKEREKSNMQSEDEFIELLKSII